YDLLVAPVTVEVEHSTREPERSRAVGFVRCHERARLERREPGVRLGPGEVVDGYPLDRGRRTYVVDVEADRAQARRSYGQRRRKEHRIATLAAEPGQPR